MNGKELSVHLLRDTIVRSTQDDVLGPVGLELFPASLSGSLTPRRLTLRGTRTIDALPGDDLWPADPVESLVQFKLIGGDGVDLS